MLIRSTLVRMSSGRYVLLSNSNIRLGHGSAASPRDRADALVSAICRLRAGVKIRRVETTARLAERADGVEVPTFGVLRHVAQVSSCPGSCGRRPIAAADRRPTTPRSRSNDSTGGGPYIARSRRTIRRRLARQHDRYVLARHLGTYRSESPTSRRTARRNARPVVDDRAALGLDDELVMIGAEVPARRGARISTSSNSARRNRSKTS